VDPRELDGGREMPNLQHNDLPTQHARRPPAGSLAARLAKARGEQERHRAPAGGAAGDDADHEDADHSPSALVSAPRQRKRRDTGAEAVAAPSYDIVERALAPAVETATAGIDDYDAVALAMDLMGQELTDVASGLAAYRGETVAPEPLGHPAYKTEPRSAGAEGADNVVTSAGIAELREQARRARDELAAVRRRGEHEKEEYTRFAKGETVKSFIPVLDDLERALAHVPARLRDDPWVAGVAMVGESVSAMLRREGVERIEPHSEPFDPRMHEAIARVEDGIAGVDDEDGADGATGVGDTVEQRVTQVYQPGYALNGRVLRPALVQVTISRQRSAVSGQPSAAGCQDDGDTFEIDRCHRLVAGHPSLLADC